MIVKREIRYLGQRWRSLTVHKLGTDNFSITREHGEIPQSGLMVEEWFTKFGWGYSDLAASSSRGSHSLHNLTRIEADRIEREWHKKCLPLFSSHRKLT